ncbi:UNKNOWN [Stylonychia lemnae]|uniref:Uncharacterized protein n=1 Tax=Stylonychia lemnae TaxID=5949 RepID=A0A078AGJ8_STYLE|nr:UNKNOWN [Stylonychia lemnae]|eukprot:CDW80662.1 UNKNOWN [Stylonychia lemnae]
MLLVYLQQTVIGSRIIIILSAVIKGDANFQKEDYEVKHLEQRFLKAKYSDQIAGEINCQITNYFKTIKLLWLILNIDVCQNFKQYTPNQSYYHSLNVYG